MFVCTRAPGLHVTVCLCIFREKEGGWELPFWFREAKILHPLQSERSVIYRVPDYVCVCMCAFVVAGQGTLIRPNGVNGQQVIVPLPPILNRESRLLTEGLCCFLRRLKKVLQGRDVTSNISHSEHHRHDCLTVGHMLSNPCKMFTT